MRNLIIVFLIFFVLGLGFLAGSFFVVPRSVASAGKVVETLKENNEKKAGFIEISGGCLARASARLTLRPAADAVEIKLYNHGFFDRAVKNGSEKIPNFTVKIKKDKAEAFLKEISKLVDSPSPTKMASSFGGRIRIYLPLKNKTIDIEWKEGEEAHDIGPLMIAVRKFVGEVAPGESP
ncbi:MAG: hypothetical protein HQ564_01175 [Candidatus Saganbacteria bacterium]|nr:hypothetical protein [Candidatus Saganbacteria bacterium]